MAKPKPKSPFVGYWRIVSMSAWDDEYLDADGQAFIDFNDQGSSSFCFGYVHGEMDCRLTARDGEPAVEWTWNGNDEMDPAQGRGWAVVNGDELHGTIFLHQGDDSEFVAKKEPQSRKKPKR